MYNALFCRIVISIVIDLPLAAVELLTMVDTKAYQALKYKTLIHSARGRHEMSLGRVVRHDITTTCSSSRINNYSYSVATCTINFISFIVLTGTGCLALCLVLSQ